MGGQTDAAAGHPGRVAQGAGHLAVPGADLQLARHHGADAGGGSPLHDGRQELARHHEVGCRGQTRARRAGHRQNSGEVEEIKRAP